MKKITWIILLLLAAIILLHVRQTISAMFRAGLYPRHPQLN